MNRNRKKTAGRAKRLAALGLAGCLAMGTGMQASAATMKDLFDEHFYADTYPDLKAAFGYNRQALWKHFITYGLKENRNMNNLIDIAKYREEYADLDAAFGNNWDAYVNHFLTHGAKEGRDSGTDFNALDYAGRYADLKEAFGDDVMALYKHYKTTGVTEHREARGEKVVVAEQAAKAAQAAASNPTSTGPSKPAAPSQETPAYTLMTDENGNVYDLGGATVYLYAWYGEEEMDTDYWRAVNEYRDWAQKTYNFTMVWDGAGNWGSYGDFADLASGAKDTEGKLRMYLLPGGVPGVVDVMRNNLMWDLSSLGVFDFGSGWYKTNGVADLYRMNGDVYACSAQPPEAGTGMVFNATLLEELTGITADQMYDWQKNGQWTWEKFEEICEMIRANGDTDGDGDQDYFAMAGNAGYLYTAFVNSNGATFFKLNSEGKFEYHVEDPATKEALEFYQKIMRADYYYHMSEGDEWDYFFDAFDKEGKFVFLPELAYQFHDGFLLNKNTENAGTYGFLMFPIGPKAGGKFVNTYSDNIWVIPKCYTEEEAKTIAAAYNIWFADIPGYSGYNSRIDGYKDGVHDDRALNETLTRMMSEGTYIDSSALLGVDYYNVWPDWSRPVDEIISDNRDQWMEAVEEYNSR